MALLEAGGRLGVFVIPFFLALELETLSSRLCAALMGLMLAIYYVGWGRYFTRGRAFRLLYAPLAGLPIPLAVAPVIYFLAAGLALRSVPLFAAAVLLAIGHLFGSAQIWRRLLARESTS